MAIEVDVWLYGALSQYGGEEDQGSFANLKMKLPENATLADLLTLIHLPSEERGISFINGELSAMPGMQPDLNHQLHDKDRVALFHLNTMWPFQYRQGIAMVSEMQEAMLESKDKGIHHAYK